MAEQKVDGKTGQVGITGWWSRDQALVIVLSAATAIAFSLCYLVARPFLPALAWALALAVVAHPLHIWFARRVRHANLAAGLAASITAVTVVVPAIFVAQHLVREAAGGVQTIKAEAASGRWRQAMEGNPRVAPFLRWVEQRIDWRSATERVEAAVAERASSWVKGSVWTLAQLLITFFSLFYFFRDRAVVLGTIRSLVPLSNAETDELFARVADTIYATVYGTLVVALVQGALGGLIFWWLGLPAPILWGVVMALLAVVPVLGAFVVWIPAAVFLTLEGDWGKALILTAWGGILISLIDNWLYPILVGKRLRLHTLPVFVAIVGGLVLFGSSGLILGPVILAVTAALIEVWRRRTVTVLRPNRELHP